MDEKKDILPLSSVAELLGAKVRTLKMYEEKMLLPKKGDAGKKLYSIDDIKAITFVHYLASVKKINANGIRYISEMITNHMNEEVKKDFFNQVEETMSKLSSKDIEELEVF